MRLTRRLLLHAAALVAVLLLFASAAVRGRAANAARADALGRLRAEAALAARTWGAGRAPADAGAGDAALADSLGALLGRHVTLVAAGGRVAGDSEARDLGAAWLARYAGLPEVRAAAADPGGAAHAGTSSAAGAAELAAAARGPAGVVRVATPAASAGAALADDLRRGLLLAGLAAFATAAAGALVFSRAVVRPLGELRDVTRALAAGDLARRPSISAPGEVGEVADAVHRLAEQLGARFDALAAEEALLEALTESLAEGVVAVDARGRVVRLNATARRLLRLTDPVPFPADYLPRDRVLRDALAEALAGRTLAAGDDAAYAGPAASDAPDAGAPELRVHGRTLALTARPLPGGGAVLAFFDLTRVRRLELVRRDFVANVSHELRTPLTAVCGYAETLADDPALDGSPRRFAATIAANARRMQRIVDDLLDLSRIESGGWAPAPARVDLALAADEALGPARDAAAAKGVALEVRPAPDAPVVWADPTAARQVLSNLVENAVRHTAAGRVAVSTERAAAGVWLVVRDSGEGIAAEHLPRIFERFYRADPGRSREQGGTGLGLAIVKHLAEAHGGRAEAESRRGEGTAIRVLFPEPLPAPAPAATPVTSPEGAFVPAAPGTPAAAS